LTARPPAWAAFFSPSAYKHFMRCVEAELSARGLAYELVDGGVALKDPPLVVGLVNLAQRCHASVPPRWPDLVRFLLDRVASVNEDEAMVRDLIGSGKGADAHLRLQIHPDEYLAPLAREELVVRPFAPDLSVCLVWDLPMSVSFVQRSDIASWNRPDDVFIDTALENVWTREPVERSTIAASPRIEQLGGDSHFTATHALLLERHLSSSDGERVLCAIPNRHRVLFVPLSAREAPRPVAEALAPHVERAFRNGPGSISPGLFWWERRGGGAWRRFDVGA
jgi:hypothetical protein